MKKIVIANNKGGVAKTTSAMNLVGYFTKKKYRVLAIDLDPQGNLTDSFGVDIDNLASTAYEALKDKNMEPYLIQIDKNTDLLPSNLDLERANLDFVSTLGRELLLKKALAKVEGNYDICIIDTSPNLSTLTLNALSCADSIYIPLRSGYFEMRGASVLLEVIEEIKEDLNPNLRIGGVFLTQYNGRVNMTNEVIGQLEEHFGSLLMNTKIRNNISLVEAPALMQNIFQYKPTSNGAKDYEELGKEILAREGIAKVKSKK
ncbi:MAG: ParA family protein [Fusobacteriaceae bacterium]